MDYWFESHRRELEISEPSDLLLALPLTTDGDGNSDDNETAEYSVAAGVEDTIIEELLLESSIDWVNKSLTWDTSIECTTRDGGFLTRRYRWSFDKDESVLVEQAAVTRAFPLLLLAGTTLLVLSTFAQVLTEGFLLTVFQAAAVAIALSGVVYAATSEPIARPLMSEERTTATYLGVTSAVGLTGVLGVGLPRLPAVFASSLAALIAGLYLRGNDRPETFGGLAEVSTRIVRATPILPRLHVLYCWLAIGALWFCITTVAHISVQSSSEVAGLWVLVLVLVGLLLGNIHERQFSRIGVAAAVVLTLSMSLLTGVWTTVDPLSASNLSQAIDPLSLSVLAIVFLTTWWAAWLYLAKLAQSAARYFHQYGRQVNTRMAGIFAYLLMCSSAILGGMILAFLWTWVQLVSTLGEVSWPMIGSLGFFGLVTALPALYFLLGSLYQLWGVLSVIRTIRRDSDPLSTYPSYQERLENLPFKPDHPIWVIDSDGYFAAAYTDPFDSAIILSHNVFETFPPEQIAAIVAHEESHFIHRGSHIQFYLALFSVFTLIGKNVIYGTYDFYTREFTADEMAVLRLNSDTNRDGQTTLSRVLLSRSNGEVNLAEEVPQFFPTMVTIPDAIYPRSLLEQSFFLLYGHFAGNVHPSDKERLDHVNSITEDDLEELPRT